MSMLNQSHIQSLERVDSTDQYDMSMCEKIENYLDDRAQCEIPMRVSLSPFLSFSVLVKENDGNS